MIGFTPAEFNQVREAIAAAHLFMQAICPVLKQRHTALNKDQRNLLQFAPEAVAQAFNAIALITHRENRDPDAVDERPAIKLQDIDTEAMRDELENVSALVLPDLVYQMVCALGELPMYHELITAEPLTTHRAAKLMAWSWEGGRRYGLQQALAIIDTTTTEFKTGTDAVLTAALNATLDLPNPELPFKPSSESPDGAAPSTIGANGEERSPRAAGKSGQHARAEIIPFEYPSAEEDTRLDPSRTRCTCKKSVLLPTHPVQHCPKCHKTWTARTLHYSSECPRCGFRLINWRRRHGIPERRHSSGPR